MPVLSEMPNSIRTIGFLSSGSSQKKLLNVQPKNGLSVGYRMPTGSSPSDRRKYQSEDWVKFKALCSELVFVLVSKDFGVEVRRLKSSRRGIQAICTARQVGMYLLHTTLSMTYQEIGTILYRDRTTIAHGCSVVEDQRDSAEFDLRIEKLENETLLIKHIVQQYMPVAGHENQ